jgi:hypothetical protein
LRGKRNIEGWPEMKEVRKGVARGLIYAAAMKFLPPSFPPVEPSLSVSLMGETIEGVRWVGNFCRIWMPHARNREGAALL